MICRELSLVASGENWSVAVPLTCRAWNCDYCAPRRRASLISLAIAGEPNRFLTLTSKRRPGLDAVTAARELAQAWRIVVKRLKRAFSVKTFDYLAVFERTKQGWPHLHLLLRSHYVPQRWLSAQMRSLIGSPVVWIERIENAKKASRYVSKYIGKDPHRFGTLKRYWHTRNYSLDQDEDSEKAEWSKYSWEKRQVDIHEIWRVWTFEGRKVRTDMVEYAYWGDVPSKLRMRWEQPPPGQGEAASLGAVIASAGCTASRTYHNPSLGGNYRGGPGAAHPGASA